MSRPSTLPEPWMSLAVKLGGAYILYETMLSRAGIPVSTAKRVCRGQGQLTYYEWSRIEGLFREYGLSLIPKK